MKHVEINAMTGEARVVELTEEEIAEIQANAQMQSNPRIDEIKLRLAQIDIDSVRPLRAIASGTDTQFDRDKLAALGAEVAALRYELASL